MRRLLGLEKAPAYIESYDISNLAGGENVAGMVVFENGRPLKSAYRKFKIKTVVGQDDYASMREVIRRRFEEYKASQRKGEQEGFGYGMVKDDKHRTRAIALDGGEIAISSHRRAFTLVSSIQDEVHRFAIGYHRQQRKKAAISSTLTSIPGIGETRAKALLRHFKTVTAVSEADLAELEGAPGMTKPAARRVWEHFHPPEGPQTPPKVGEEGPNPGEIAPNS